MLNLATYKWEAELVEGGELGSQRAIFVYYDDQQMVYKRSMLFTAGWMMNLLNPLVFNTKNSLLGLPGCSGPNLKGKCGYW